MGWVGGGGFTALRLSITSTFFIAGRQPPKTQIAKLLGPGRWLREFQKPESVCRLSGDSKLLTPDIAAGPGASGEASSVLLRSTRSEMGPGAVISLKGKPAKNSPDIMYVGAAAIQAVVDELGVSVGGPRYENICTFPSGASLTGRR